MGTRNRRKHPSITIHISRAQNSIWFRESPDHKQMLFGSENYSGKKILWPVMAVWVQVPLAVQFRGISSEGRIRTFQFEVWVRSLHSAQKIIIIFEKIIFINIYINKI